ncbi:MAG: SDR family NAD(P)-dependent oxidoreductase [Chromatiales bacterium]|nr:MAG: SDR family NAD(P)-dependent oxidoreductase [Chromatiales bacterium]
MTTNRRAFMWTAGASLMLPSLVACGGADKVADDSVPASDFDQDSTAEEVTAGLDLRGKFAVVTGCTSGIGFETMRVLAQRGALVAGTSRSLERAREACGQVGGTTMPLQLDLGDFDTVVRCAEVIRAYQAPVDMLICNAGYRGGGNERQLVNGVEKHFAINHLGHFILINRLMDRLYVSWQGRIVIVASRTAYRDAPEEGILFDDLDMARSYSDAEAYGHSKLANALCSLQLGEVLRGTRITSNAVHPGVIKTDLDRNLSAVSQLAWEAYAKLKGKSIEQGAATSCYVATHPSLGNISGKYFEDCNAVTIEGRGHMQNLAMAEQLLQTSIELTADWLVEFKKPERSNIERQE